MKIGCSLVGIGIVGSVQNLRPSSFISNRVRFSAPMVCGRIWEPVRGADNVRQLLAHNRPNSRQGLHVMTTHKSKGKVKEFSDSVDEGVHYARFKPANATNREIAQARLSLGVTVTRAMNHASVLTPKSDCSLLLEIARLARAGWEQLRCRP